MRVLRQASLHRETPRIMTPGGQADQGFEEVERDIDRARQNALLRDAVSQLRPLCRELLWKLFGEGEPSYRTIAGELGMKVGSIGPTRQRCLEELRRCPAFAALLGDEDHGTEGGGSDDSYRME
jgi:DNA-directed RNA polymerase specialized sigma24 family protein